MQTTPAGLTYSNMDKSVEVVVIGGGISGLCAAKLLSLENGVSVIVLEARDRVGGRTNTLEDPRFKYADLGGAYIGPTQNRIVRVAKELGVQTYKVFDEGDTVEFIDGRRRVFSGIVSTWNPIAMVDFYNMIRTLDKMCKEVPLDEPWKAPKSAEWDSMTVKEFFDKTCWTSYTKKRMTQVYNDAMGAEPEDMSLLFYLWSLKSGDGVLRVGAIENTGQEMKFIGGSQQISNRIKDKLGDRVNRLTVFISLKIYNRRSVIIICRWCVAGRVGEWERSGRNFIKVVSQSIHNQLMSIVRAKLMYANIFLIFTRPTGQSHKISYKLQ